MTKYLLCLSQIEAVEVVKETKNYVYLRCSDGLRRVVKRAWDRSYFDTWAEAREALVGNITEEIDYLKSQVRCKLVELDKAFALVPPEGEGT